MIKCEGMTGRSWKEKDRRVESGFHGHTSLKGQIGQYAGIGFLVQIKADSNTENLDPIPNNISNDNPKINTERKLKQYGRKIGTRIWVRIPGTGCYNMILPLFFKILVFILYFSLNLGKGIIPSSSTFFTQIYSIKIIMIMFISIRCLKMCISSYPQNL